MNQQTDNAPDTLLEQVKELRPKVEKGKWRLTTALGSDDLPEPNAKLMGMSSQMADRIIADAEERRQDALIIAKSAEREMALLAENQRLREALEKIAVYDSCWESYDAVVMYNLAKQALALTDEEQKQ